MSNKSQDQSDNQENTKSARNALAVVIAIIIVGVGVYAIRSNDKSNDTQSNTENTQREETAVDEYAGWKESVWDSQHLAFQRPDTWFIEENAGMSRIYIKNSEVDLLKEETPENFQQLWISYDVDETSAAREEAIKNGESAYRVVDGEVTASTVMAGETTINIYEYNTLGGPTLEAYWTDHHGTRYYATNSTEVGEANQTEMVATLKKLLASIKEHHETDGI